VAPANDHLVLAHISGKMRKRFHSPNDRRSGEGTQFVPASIYLVWRFRIRSMLASSYDRGAYTASPSDGTQLSGLPTKQPSKSKRKRTTQLSDPLSFCFAKSRKTSFVVLADE